MLHIAISGEKLFSLLGFPITNTLLTTWIVMALLAILAIRTSSRISLIPGPLQNGMEIVLGSLFSLFEGILGDRTRSYFPLLATLFIFIIASNWIGLLPGVGSITLSHTSAAIQEIGDESTQGKPIVVEEEHGVVQESIVEDSAAHEESVVHETKTPIFRAPTADLNTTFALALISFITLQYSGIKALGGMTYLGKYINFSNPIALFVGILELISELGKVISFAFRLFGNIFAGEVLLAVMAFLIPVFAPVPFLGLELFVGFIQALVFAILTAVFLAAATVHEGH